MPAPSGPPRPPGESGPGDVVYAAILKEAAPIAEMPVALEAELAASSLLGGVYAASDIRRTEAVHRFAADFGHYLADRATPETVAVRAALAALLPDAVPPSGREPDAAPAWLPAVGDVTCTGTWAVQDGYGDQTSYVATFRYADPDRGGPEHAVSYLLDHNLRTVKSLSVGVPADVVVDGWREAAEEDPQITFDAVVPERIRSDVTAYLAASDEQPTPPAERYVEERAFALSRLALLPAGDPVVRRPLGDRERDAAVSEFLASPEGALGTGDQPATTVIAWCARAAVDFAVDDGAGDPLRWSPAAVELMLLDWAPRQLSRTHPAAPWLPEVLDAFVTYAGRVRGLDPAAVAATQDAVTASAVRYTDLMTGDTLGEPVADVLARMVADGVDPLDEDAVLQWVLADRARRGAD